MQKLRQSRQASVFSIFAAVLGYVLIRIGYINAYTQAFTFNLSQVLYAVGLILIASALVFAAIYARSVTILAMGIIFIFFVHGALSRIDPAYLGYLIHKDEYLAKIAKSDAPDPEFVIFKWKESHGFPAGIALEDFVYDSSDQIGMPENERTLEWEKLHGSFVQPLGHLCSVTIRHIEEHFFYVEEVC